MKQNYKMRSAGFLVAAVLLGITVSTPLVHSENIDLDLLKAKFPPGERYFSLGKRDPFVPLVSPKKNVIKKIARKSKHPRKKVVSVKSKDLDMPSDMPLLPMKFYEKIQKEDSDIVIQLQIFATLFNDTTKLRKMSNKEYKKKVAEYRSLLTEVLGMRESILIRTELQANFDKLEFVGTIRKTGISVALVQTQGQKGHTVKVGTLIGPNLGIVKTIDAEKIVILERYRNYLGEVLSQDKKIEFKKQPLQG